MVLYKVLIMGRKKLYDRQEIIEKATRHFHENGFNYSKTKDIVEAVGINKFSLYSEFKTNKELFIECLNFYYDKFFVLNFGLIDSDDADVDSIIEFFKWLPKKSNQKVRYGCFILNSAAEFADNDEEVNEIIDKYIGRIKKAFKNALARSIKDGSLNKKMDTTSVANYLTNNVIGIMISNRAKLPVKSINDTGTNIILFLSSFKA
jgi:TetR/AcrR family transcriptional repressor of nem operon